MSSTTEWPSALRRVVTANDGQGRGNIQSDVNIESKPMGIVPGGRVTPIWVTTDGLPTKDLLNDEDGGARTLDAIYNFGIVPYGGTNLQATDLAPGVVTPMHRTSSLDFNILISGELILMMDDGSDRHIKTPGDTVIQRGGMHAWRNPSKDTWARYVSVLMSAAPAVVDGKPLEPALLPLGGPDGPA